MATCSNCGKSDWPDNLTPILKQVGEGCPACNPEFADAVLD